MACQTIAWTNVDFSSCGEVLWHSPVSNFTARTQATILYNEFQNHISIITATSLRSQWFICYMHWHAMFQNMLLGYHSYLKQECRFLAWNGKQRILERQEVSHSGQVTKDRGARRQIGYNISSKKASRLLTYSGNGVLMLPVLPD